MLQALADGVGAEVADELRADQGRQHPDGLTTPCGPITVSRMAGPTANQLLPGTTSKRLGGTRGRHHVGDHAERYGQHRERGDQGRRYA